MAPACPPLPLSRTKCGLRVAGRAATRAEACRIANEVETLYTNGPAGGGGATQSAKEVLAVQSVLLPRELVVPTVEMLEA